MPGRKKLVVVVSLLATGISTALFFRKDASQDEQRQDAYSEFPFGERVEHRVSPGATLPKGTGSRAWNEPAARQALRVPSSVTASISEQGPATAEPRPTFQKSFSAVGSLLEPIEASHADDPPERDFPAEIEPAIDNPSPRIPLTHTIVDGDTLSSLATQYLGRGDRYREIFEFNRAVLSNPDLLPIGVVLKIPPRENKSSVRWEGSAPDESSSHLELVPLKPAPPADDR